MRSNVKIKTMCYIGLTTAIICILGPLSLPIPISPVPVSLAIFGIYIASYVLGSRGAAAACVLYILIGLLGVPVFAAFTGGPQKLFGPTGGYILGYLAVAYFTGLFVERYEDRLYMHAAGMVLGLLICYSLGTLWLAVSAGMTASAALLSGVLPFIPMDIVKMLLAVAVGVPLRRAIKRVSGFEKGYQGLSG